MKINVKWGGCCSLSPTNSLIICCFTAVWVWNRDSRGSCVSLLAIWVQSLELGREMRFSQAKEPKNHFQPLLQLPGSVSPQFAPKSRLLPVLNPPRAEDAPQGWIFHEIPGVLSCRRSSRSTWALSVGSERLRNSRGAGISLQEGLEQQEKPRPAGELGWGKRWRWDGTTLGTPSPWDVILNVNPEQFCTT